MDKAFALRSREFFAEINEAITKNYFGTILVIDGEGKVIYIRNRSENNPYSHVAFPESFQDMLNKPLSNYFKDSPSLKVLKTKKTEVEFIGGYSDPPIVTVSEPIFDDAGRLIMVIAYSLNERMVYMLTEKIEKEKNNALQLLDYFSNIDDKNILIVAENPIMKQIFSELKIVADSDSTVMLRGESGTGKEVFARFIHANSPRKNRIFVPVNCAAIPPDLLESEFFGYSKGAFTGANKDGKAGLFELADNGTLFLDEIGELTLPLQSKLLRVIESGEFRRIGGSKIIRSNVRLVAATNRNLAEMVKNRSFREDLYYRLNVIPIRIPPIRERKEDIEPLVKHFLNDYNKKYGTIKILAQDTLEDLKKYDWPGNVREIRNIVERMYITSTTSVITMRRYDQVSDENREIVMDSEETSAQSLKATDTSLPYKEAMLAYEKRYISAKLAACGGNISLAAKELGLSRSGLYKKLNLFQK